MIQAGVAKICITPPVGTWQGGYGARTRPSEGVHDDLFARALVLRGEAGAPPVAIVSVDVTNLTHEVANGARRRAEQMTGIPAANIALCASHTHGGPIFRPFLGRPGPQPDSDYLLLLEKYLAGAIVAASRDLRPVALRLGRGEASFNVNRRLPTPDGLQMRPNPAGVVDREVLVLRVDAVDAEDAPRGAAPLAILFRFTCHSTAMGANNYLLTADYPGAAAAHIEATYGTGTITLFLQGCAGNVRPHIKSATGGFTSADWTILARLGRELGSATVGAAERSLTSGDVGHEGATDRPIAAASETVTLPFAALPDPDELRAVVENGRWSDGREPNDFERAWAAQTLDTLRAGTAGDGVPAQIQVFRLAGYVLVTLPGEVFVEIGWRVRDAVAKTLGLDPSRVIVAAYANGSVGYVPTAAAIPEGGYEPFAYRHQGRPAGYAPEAEDLFTQTAARVAAQLR